MAQTLGSRYQTPINAGFYRNFGRAIGLLPEGCGWIACADQDDEWLPGKLEILLREAKRTQSPPIFSDMAVYSNNGQKLSEHILDSPPPVLPSLAISRLSLKSLSDPYRRHADRFRAWVLLNATTNHPCAISPVAG